MVLHERIPPNTVRENSEIPISRPDTSRPARRSQAEVIIRQNEYQFMTAERLTLRICERIAHIQLSRPEAHNAMDPAFVNEFSSAIDVVEAEQSVRTVLISALGPSFCVGGDLAYFSSRPAHLTEDLKWLVDHWHKLL